MMLKPKGRAAVGPPRSHSAPLLSVEARLSLNISIFYRCKLRPSLCLSNCKRIEVAIIYPLNAVDYLDTEDSSLLPEFAAVLDSSESVSQAPKHTLEPGDMLADQERNAGDLHCSPITSQTSRVDDIAPVDTEVFRFLDLPVEIRLKIYAFLVPPRAHNVVTQIPHNGYFYNTATISEHSATSFYPFGRLPPNSTQIKYTTYKVLNANFRNNYPAPSLHPEILLVSKQILAEAEPVLYGSNEAVWDFGIHQDALVAFWGDRSKVARECVRNIKMAREIPGTSQFVNGGAVAITPAWEKACNFITTQLPNIRTLDLTMWSSSGSTASFPSLANTTPIAPDTDDVHTLSLASQADLERQWREWDWTASLLKMESLKQARVTWWGFQSTKSEGGSVHMHSGFDSWIAGRMVGDRVVRERMVRDGIVVEGVVVLSGLGLGLGLGGNSASS